ncbi:MAG TPA: DUF2304 domain-containing protein [Patescibacteria group bacterium]|nr:DUF2304 domain-containing protein [Patescibacteria group bacterium]
MIIGLQIMALLFAFSMTYFAILGFKRGELTKLEIISWLVLWCFAIIVVVFPELLRSFSMTFLVTRVFDLMVIGGFALVISMVGSTYLRTKRNEKKLEDLVRKEAFKNAKRKK